MLKKMTVLAMAVGVVAALALPASASAFWKHHQTPIQQNQTIGFTGNAKFQGGLGGIECQTTSAVKFEAGTTTGRIHTFVPHPTSDTANCKGLGGLAFCQIHGLTPQTPEWIIHLYPHEITLPSGQTHDAKIGITTTNLSSQATGGFCPVKEINLTAGQVLATPNQPNTVSSVSLSGSLQADLTTNNGVGDKETVTISGSLNIESPNGATYSI